MRRHPTSNRPTIARVLTAPRPASWPAAVCREPAVPLPTDQAGALGRSVRTPTAASAPTASTGPSACSTCSSTTTRLKRATSVPEACTCGIKRARTSSPLVSPSNYIPTFLTMPSASTFASLTKTLADVKSYHRARRNCRTIPTNDLAALRLGSEHRRLRSAGHLHLSRTRAAVEPALLERVGFHRRLHLEPPGGRRHRDQFLNLPDAAPRSGFPEPQSGLGELPRSIAASASPSRRSMNSGRSRMATG